MKGDREIAVQLGWCWTPCCTGGDSDCEMWESLFPIHLQMNTKRHMDVSLWLPQQNAAEGNDVLFNSVTGYESWFHYFDPETKQQHGIASHNISKQEGQICTFNQQSYGNCFLRCQGMNIG
jgi:hypothetical protein